MRIDSLTYFNASLAGMRDNQSAIARLSQQIATGKALLAPKDDPLATEQILELSNRVAVRTQYVSNQDRAELALKYETTVIQEMSKTLNDARGLMNVSPSHDASFRNLHAEQLRGFFNHLMGLANTRDPGGNFIFGGFETTLPGTQRPYERTLDGGATPTTYNGSPLPGGTRSIEVDLNRPIQVNDNIAGVFSFVDATLADPADPLADPTDPLYVAGTPHDLFRNLDHAITNLPGATITQADIDGYRALIDTTLSKLALIEHRIAGALTEIADVRATSESLLLQERNALGDLQQVDQTLAIVQLQTRQTALEAAQRAYARTSDLTLFSFLG